VDRNVTTQEYILHFETPLQTTTVQRPTRNVNKYTLGTR